MFSFLSKDVWQATAIINPPLSQDMLQLNQQKAQLALFGLSGIPSAGSLYNNFTLEFNKYDNKRAFLSQPEIFPLFNHNINDDNDNNRQKIIQKVAKEIDIEPVDQKGKEPGLIITFSSDGKERAFELLKQYSQFIISIQKERLYKELRQRRDFSLTQIKTKQQLMREDAKRQQERELNELKHSLEIAQAAKTPRPLENFSSRERYSITLGSDALAKKLAILANLTVEQYKPQLNELNVQYQRLSSIDIKEVAFRPFSYLHSPEPPLNRASPKRGLIVILSLLLGLMVGCAAALVLSKVKYRTAKGVSLVPQLQAS